MNFMVKKYFFLYIVALFFGISTYSQMEHSTFTKILQKHVSKEGFVNYSTLQKEEKQLDQYLDLLAKNTPKESWKRTEKMAYLINTYNAYTLKLILLHYPVESIKDIGSVLESPFKMKFIPFNGKQLSLDDIEKGMLLPMQDPRVHFAINCASESCPKLQAFAFEANQLDKQLEEVTKAFINSAENEISPKALVLSKIFKWYASDFEAAAGSVPEFISPYVSFTIPKNTPISYRDYSWKLNGK